MKRCIVCGNVGEDNSTVCDVCGAPYGDMTYGAVETPEEVQQTEEAVNDSDEDYEQTEMMRNYSVPQTEETESEDETINMDQVMAPAQETEQPRVMRSGPQIYGQEDATQAHQEMAPQGMIRRNMQGMPQQGYPNPQMQGYPNPQMQQGYPNPQMQGYPNPQMQQGYPNQARGPQGQPNYPGQMRAPQGQPMPPRQTQNPAQQNNLVMTTSRKMMRSPLFFLIVLLNTVYVAGSVAAIFMNQLNYSQYVKLIGNADLPASISAYSGTIVTILSKLDSGFIIANIALRIPDILFCLGLWLIFITAIAAREGMSGIGFGFAKVKIIINMIGSCLAMLGVLVISVAFVVSAKIAENQMLLVVSVIVLVAIIVIVMMVIMYYFSYLASLKTCRINGDTGDSYGKVSSYVAVLHIIFALFSVVSLLSGIVNNEMAAIAGAAGNMGWMILFGIWMLIYRGKLADIEED